MNDQSQLINQAPPMANQGPMFGGQQQQPPPPMPMSQPQLMGASKAMSLPQIRTASQPQMLLGQRQSPAFGLPMLSRGYKPWPPPQLLQQQLGMDPSAKFRGGLKPGFGAMKQQGRGNWKGKKPNDKRVDLRKAPNPSVNAVMAGAVGAGSYQPPSLNELQSQNHLKARKFYPKKKFNNRFAPYAPRNTSSYIMRAKKSGGIASLVSPSPVTPAVLPTPRFSPTTEVLGDMAKEEWGVDGYGSMKGLIRLRNEAGFREHEEEEEGEDHEEDDNDGSSESDVEEEKNSVLSRLDHETSRFEMVYPNYGGDYNNILENRVDDQDAHIAQLEEENLTLKERLFLMERELGDLRKRLQLLERQNQGMDYVNEEVVENVSENDSGGGSDIHGMECESKEEVMEYGVGNVGGTNIDAGNDSRRENNDLAISEGGRDISMDEYARKRVMPEEGHLKGGEMQNENMPIEASTEQDELKNTGQVRDLATAEVDVKKLDIEDEDVGTVHSEKSIGDGD
ncbi:uncharacterized protein LOC115679123 [Syzygium oleosum]|uniref:uncharacterized protein LOC115679123 n=1 Tax=Syzygium oleosum TaxID=219896 RepID=UPI0011D2B794|nr:uncharacterized protein LOC115679123 [Syzygium oleosum]XP_056165722.1 uncharacterized protein LOC115679123 [Syzygium oleosum]